MRPSYSIVGTNNMKAAVEFYDALFEQTGPKQSMANERMTFWQGQDFVFAVAIPYDEKAASNGNGTMLGFDVDSQEEVKRLHQKVIDLGGKCEGEPGQRGPVYSAYARDLDNNKISFYVFS